MPPPLLQLKDIALTFGGTPLLTGAELSVSTGERISPGRAQRVRQIDLAENRRGHGRAGPRLGVRPAGRDHPLSAAGAGLRRIRNHPRLCRGRTRPGRRPSRRPLSAGAAGPQRRRASGASLRRRSAPHVARAGAGAVARYPAARRADQPSRPDHDRMAGARSRCAPHRAGDHQPRPAFPVDAVARHGLARSRRKPAAWNAASPISRSGATRCWRKKNATSTSSTARSSPKSIGCATASPRGASATCAASGNCRRCGNSAAPSGRAPAAPRSSPAPRPSPARW